jgi:hypothetical protein
VSDEVRHAEVCRALAAKYSADEVRWPGAVAIDPAPARNDHALRTVFHVVSMCCVNESVASTFLEASLSGARSPSARAAIGELLADEVEHARAGWLFVAKLPAAMRAAVETNLLPLVQAVARCWWEPGPVTLPEGAPEHGIPGLRTTRESVLTAVRDIVLPGFNELGVCTRAIEEWAAERSAALAPDSQI